jgi:1,4-dihydroxy-2-naphthoate octaprenyltransferase
VRALVLAFLAVFTGCAVLFASQGRWLRYLIMLVACVSAGSPLLKSRGTAR